MLIIAAPATTCMAQRKASYKVEKELFGKHRRGKPINDKIKTRGAAAKAIKKQDKKEAKRKQEDTRTVKDLRQRHISMQSSSTQERMKNNGKATAEKYKAKRQKQHKEQKRPKTNGKRKP